MKGKEPSNKYFDKMKHYLITLLYLAIFIALYLIYGSGDTQNNFIYNEF
ncbi:teichoic acid D-Ala incorporation-associated protein DltX [Staphylococcus epidermidis]|nr:teichoic acid D-Ala incorporation-associated protein DltX [Staphylococcus epidermidis]UZT88544.1 teichoic acid D-Ala incorporation-associated protein DltX [Staphylococcus epidermidis]